MKSKVFTQSEKKFKIQRPNVVSIAVDNVDKYAFHFGKCAVFVFSFEIRFKCCIPFECIIFDMNFLCPFVFAFTFKSTMAYIKKSK